MRAAVLEAGRTPLQIVDDVAVGELGPRQVLVRVKHCGVCHSDLTIIDSESPGPLPMILGHEAAGIVEAVGPGVRTVAPGDHAILVAVAPCGLCYWCVRGEPTSCQEARSFMSGALPDGTIALSRKEEPVYRGLGVGGFGEYVVTTDNAVVRVDPDLPLDLASVIGCAVQTGVGAVFNTAKVEPGATVLVMGLGGIGMSVVQGARLAGASRIIVTDLLAERREAAAQFGATDVIDPATHDLVATTNHLTAGIGVDYAFDAAGSARLVEAGIQATRIGGTTVCVGAPSADQAVTIAPAVLFLVQEKKLLGCLYGGGNAHREIPRLISLWRRGALDLAAMVSFSRPLEDVNLALDDLRAGRGIRTVLSL
jgi:S-(hydroxymethyl)glutathione dehydrogenase / alcohol dehydrogenase